MACDPGPAIHALAFHWILLLHSRKLHDHISCRRQYTAACPYSQDDQQALDAQRYVKMHWMGQSQNAGIDSFRLFSDLSPARMPVFKLAPSGPQMGNDGSGYKLTQPFPAPLL
jgi:hypothetical protein